ncbi:MAG: TonB-dependent receptor [Thermoanaerobaculia bacterium]
MHIVAILLALLFADVPAAPLPASPASSEATSGEAAEPAIAETIVVTATRSERAVSELPVTTAVVTEQQIGSAPVRSVDDLLRSVPGVTPSVISSSGSTPNNQRFSMHGLGGNRALVLVDGVPLHDPYSGIVQWQYVPLQRLRQIEVVRGANASLFGNYALGGTVNLITRPVEDNDLALDLSYGSWDTYRGAFTFDALVNRALSLRVTHDQSDTGGYPRVPDPGPIDIDAWVENTITSVRAELRPSERTNGFVNASSAQLDASQGTPLSFSKRDITAFSGGYNQAVGTAGLVSLNAYTQDQEEHLVNSSIASDRSSETLTQDGTIASTGSGGSLVWTTQRPGAFPLLSVGADVQQLETTEDRDVFDRTGAVTQQVVVGGRQQFAGVFAQASWQPVDRLELLGSARFDWFNNEDGFEQIVGGESTVYPDKSSSEFDPRISARYALGARSAIRAAVYRGFSAPTLRDLYRSNQSGRSIILGNPELESETLEGGDMSLEWANGTARFEVNLYRSTIDDLKSLVLIPGTGNVYQYRNLGTSRSQGVEVTADLRLSRRWELYGSYTFADAVITSDPAGGLEGNRVAEVPRHAGALALRFTGEKGASGEIRGRAVGDSYGDASNLALSPAHQVLDLAYARPVRPGLELYVLAENVFDEEYYLALTATSFRSGLPRTITAGVRLDRFRWRSN